MMMMHVVQLVINDFLQTIMHLAEHKVSPAIYKVCTLYQLTCTFPRAFLLLTNMHCTQSSHKPHHRFLNPKLFDAFNGSVADTVCMILIPLSVTAQLVVPRLLHKQYNMSTRTDQDA